MKLFFKLTLYVLLLVPGLWQDLYSNDEIKMYLDFARFRYDDDNTYLEIYYSLLKQTSNEVENSGSIHLNFSLLNKDEKKVLAKEKITVNLGEDSEQKLKGSLIKTVLPSGNYLIKMVRLSGSTEERKDSIQYEFTTSSFNGDKIKISDIELCSNIRVNSPHKGALFYKNTMEIYPNPTRVYGISNPQLFYYLEAYNLLKNGESKNQKVEIHAAIKDQSGETVTEKRYQKEAISESLVEVGRFNVSKLANGMYSLMVAIVDPLNEYSTFNLSHFYVVNNVNANNDLMAMFPKSEYFNMPQEEVIKKFNQARYITSQSDVQIFNSMVTVESQRIFLFKLWHNIEQDKPGLQDEYYRRVDYCNGRYAFANFEGWESDRGRIYILYGEPDEYYRRPSSLESKPYEIWDYHDLQNGAKFLFIDVSGFKDYQLKSSTLRGEIHDPNYDVYFTGQGVR